MKTRYTYTILTCVAFFLDLVCVQAQQLRGHVRSADSRIPLPQVTIYGPDRSVLGTTDSKGFFEIALTGVGDTGIVLSHMGYTDLRVQKDSLMAHRDNLVLFMTAHNRELETIDIATGYYNLPKERATGSFESINNALYERAVSTDIISRLEGVVGGLQFDRRSTGAVAGADNLRNLRLRGVNTVFSEESPLIILDNFPYDGTLEDINPNDIESVTVLKDAAAASIWGARAGNGVIVLTSKSAKAGESMRIDLNINQTFSPRPDLGYGQNFIGSAAYLELEKFYFDNGLYDARLNDGNRPYLSPAVELLLREKNEDITSSEREARFAELAGYDVRSHIGSLLYRPERRQQYALSWNGNTPKLAYHVSVGHDDNDNSNLGNTFGRTTLNSNMEYRFSEKVSMGTQLMLGQSKNRNNGLDIRNLPTYLPYGRLQDADGQALAIGHTYRTGYLQEEEAGGLLPWSYVPLTEQELHDLGHERLNARVNLRLGYRPTASLKFSIHYLHHREVSDMHNRRDKDSYYVRNLVNRYTQPSGIQAFPYGDVLYEQYGRTTSNNLRLQMDYGRSIGHTGEINLLLGAEAREIQSNSGSFTYYGYDPDVLTVQSRLNYTANLPLRPLGSGFIPVPAQSLSDHLDRYISYYFNGGYTLASRYLLSASLRWDASNLFGVATNQKGVPLWSVGAAWNLLQEDFINKSVWSALKLRLTHGVSGNINKTVTAYPTLLFSTSTVGNYRSATVRSPGNPDLRWERVRTTNIGLEVGLLDNLVTGSLDLYQKNGSDLFGETFIDPTVFFGGSTTKLMMNYADISTRGYDLSLALRPVGKKVKWGANILLSRSTNKMTKYHGPEYEARTYTSGTSNRPGEGKSLDMLYSLPWHGLDPATGDPWVMENGEATKEYTRYLNGLALEDMVAHGSSVPLWQSFFRQSLSVGPLVFSANIAFKGGYYFRRGTVMYNNLILGNGLGMHVDYHDRWQAPGDEQRTDVPSLVPSTVANRDLIYSLSEKLVEPGDHIRLQDIRLDYTFSLRSRYIRSVQLYSFMSNLGILWKRTAMDIDPDYPSAMYYLPPRTFSFGLKITY